MIEANNGLVNLVETSYVRLGVAPGESAYSYLKRVSLQLNQTCGYKTFTETLR